MKLFFLSTGLLVIVGGALLIFLPKVLIKLGDMINRMTITDDLIFLKRYIIGLSLMLVGGYLIYTYFMI